MSLVNSVAMHEELLTQKSFSNKAAFCWLLYYKLQIAQILPAKFHWAMVNATAPLLSFGELVEMVSGQNSACLFVEP